MAIPTGQDRQQRWLHVMGTIIEHNPPRTKYVPFDPDQDGLPGDDRDFARSLVNRALRLERLIELGAPQIIIGAEIILVAKALLWLPPPGDDAMRLDSDADPQPEPLWPGPDGNTPPDLRIVD